MHVGVSAPRPPMPPNSTFKPGKQGFRTRQHTQFLRNIVERPQSPHVLWRGVLVSMFLITVKNSTLPVSTRSDLVFFVEMRAWDAEISVSR